MPNRHKGEKTARTSTWRREQRKIDIITNTNPLQRPKEVNNKNEFIIIIIQMDWMSSFRCDETLAATFSSIFYDYDFIVFLLLLPFWLCVY